jgi:hypothetical protein
VNIAELFVNLGITGADKTVGALTSVKKGLGEVSSMSLEAKAAILAAVYGLERMMSASGMAGTNLTNFTSLTGLSTKALQQWQYGMVTAGGTADEMTTNIMAIQKAVAATDWGKGVPEGWAILANASGDKDLWAHKSDPFYIAKAFIKGINSAGKNPETMAAMNALANSVGLTDHFISGGRRGKFEQSNLDHAPVRSEAMISSLDKSHVALATAEMKMGMLFDKFTSRHGQQLAGDMLKIATAIFKVADAMDILATKLKLFQAIEKTVETIAKIMEGWGFIIDDMTKTRPNQLPPGLFAPGALAHPMLDPTNQAYQNTVAPTMSFEPRPSVVNTQTINQKITHNGDAKDTNAVKKTHGTGAKQAYFKRPINVGG